MADKVSVPGFLEHIALQRRQGLAFDAVADPPDMRQLQGQGLDLEVLLLDLGVLGLQFGILGLQLRDRLIGLLEQRLHDGRHLRFGGGVEVQLIEFGERIHGRHYTLKNRCMPCFYWVSGHFTRPFRPANRPAAKPTTAASPRRRSATAIAPD
jgi:hypothetical protein